MDHDLQLSDLDAWKLCFEINLYFQVSVAPGPWRCLSCGKRDRTLDASYRSDFVKTAAWCAESHGELWKYLEVDVCTECRQDIILNISKRKQICFQPGCRRVMEVKKYVVRDRVKDQELLKKYFQFIDQHGFFECMVCLLDIPVVDGPVQPPTARCHHDPSTCQSCLERLLKEKIDNGKWKDIKCPERECDTILTSEDIRRAVGPEIFKKYSTVVNQDRIFKDPNFRWCKDKVCGGSQFVELKTSNSNPEWKCLKCKKTNCFYCKPDSDEICAWHQAQPSAVSESEMELRKTSKRCPRKGCGKAIQLKSGCNHMRCAKEAGGCGTAFCWVCKVIFSCSASCHSCHFSERHLDGCREGSSSRILSKPSHWDSRYRPGWDSDPDYRGEGKFP